MDLDMLASQPSTHKVMRPIPQFPAIRRDLALLVPSGIKHDDLAELIRKEGGKLLESCSLFDVYEGKGIEPGKKSMAFNMVFRSQERTLTDEEIQPIIDAIVNRAGKEFNAKLRAG